MSRFYCPNEYIKGNIANLPKEESHHLIDVMRLKKGDEVVLFDGKGKEYYGIIEKQSSKGAVVCINRIKDVTVAVKNKIILVQAIPKKSKMDFIVEKATELGADEIIPAVTERTIVDFDGAKRMQKKDRWQKIALEASKQCNRLNIPKVTDIVELPHALNMIKDASLKLVATLYEPSTQLNTALKSHKEGPIAILIGPEGDFTPKEIDTAIKDKAIAVTFGKRVLKSDTAALFALSVISSQING